MPIRLRLPFAFAALLAVSAHAAEPAAKDQGTTPVPADVAAILARNLKALGGADTFRKQTVRALKGELELAAVPGAKLKFVSLAKAPDKLLQAVDIPNVGTATAGIAGGEGWFVQPGGSAQDITGDQLKDLRRQADYWWPVELPHRLSRLAVKGTAQVGQTDCDVVEGTDTDGKTERLYFAKSTGLLARRDHFAFTDAGMQMAQDLFEDYRPVAGIPVPHLLRRTQPESATFTFRVTDVGTGGNPDDATFKKPVK